MDSYLVKPRIYMDRDGLTEILQGRKKAFLITDLSGLCKEQGF